jgi:SAM-dependent methyltransferase
MNTTVEKGGQDMFRNSAHVYDAIYAAMGKDYEAESAEVDAIIQQRKPGAASLLDVACGTGGHLRYLQRRYATVAGIELDPSMLAEARKALEGVDLYEGDMRLFGLGRRFDAVTCLFSSVGYLQDTDELNRAIGSMARHLSVGGVLIVDGWVRPDQWVGTGSVHMEAADADDDIKVARVGRSQRIGNKTILDMEYLVGTRHRIDHLVDHHEMTLFTPEEYESALRGAGLSIEVVASPMEGRDRYIGVLA